MIVYICIYIKRDRETERQTEGDRERWEIKTGRLK